MIKMSFWMDKSSVRSWRITLGADYFAIVTNSSRHGNPYKRTLVYKQWKRWGVFGMGTIPFSGRF